MANLILFQIPVPKENCNIIQECSMKEEVIELIKKEVKSLFLNDYSGHDYFHTERVYRNALLLTDKIPCNKDLVILSSLLHDVDDPKLFTTTNNQNARNIMSKYSISPNVIEEVIKIINKISFKGSGKDVPSSIEGKIVQDADRLDALGAIGIARAFAYGGHHNRKMYDTEEVPVLNRDEKTYHQSKGTTINHFYEKLLLLKDLMNTTYAKEIAEKRTKVMEEFLKEFIEEWNGEL